MKRFICCPTSAPGLGGASASVIAGADWGQDTRVSLPKILWNNLWSIISRYSLQTGAEILWNNLWLEASPVDAICEAGLRGDNCLMTDQNNPWSWGSLFSVNDKFCFGNHSCRSFFADIVLLDNFFANCNSGQLVFKFLIICSNFCKLLLWISFANCCCG